MSLVISAAISGSGAALVPRIFIKRDLDAGRLVMVGEPGFESQEGYWLCLLNRPAPHPGLPAFTSWVLDEARALTRY